MNKQKAFKLAKALESGKYKQGKHTLKDETGNKYCCLGVACEINGVRSKRNMHAGGFLGWDYEGEMDLLSEKARVKTGINSSIGEFDVSVRCRKDKSKRFKRYGTLAALNDAGFSFKFIAKIIRKHYKNIK